MDDCIVLTWILPAYSVYGVGLDVRFRPKADIQLSPQGPSLRLLEGKARFASGDSEGATECVNEVLERNPRHLEADALARHLLKAAS